MQTRYRPFFSDRSPDSSGLESDCKVEIPAGDWADLEVNIGGAMRNEEAASNLHKLASKVSEAM